MDVQTDFRWTYGRHGYTDILTDPNYTAIKNFVTKLCFALQYPVSDIRPNMYPAQPSKNLLLSISSCFYYPEFKVEYKI